MATEKLTIVAPLTIRLTESQDRDVRGLAELRGMERSEYIRHLVALDKAEQERIWLARNQLFSIDGANSINSAAHNVRRDV